MMTLADRQLGRRTFVPRPLPSSGLLGWWDASRLVLDHLDPVTLWPDLSGNGLHFAAQTATPPVFVADAYNGLPCIRFNRDNERHLDTPTFPALSQPATIVVVCASNDSQPGYIFLDTPSGSRWTVGAGTGTASNLAIWAGGGNPAGLPYRTWSLSVIAGTVEGDRSIIYNLTGNESQHSGTGTAGDITAFRLGRHQSTSGRRFDGDVCELAIWTRRLTVPELATIHEHLAIKWGLS